MAKTFSRFAPVLKDRFGITTCCDREVTFPMKDLDKVKRELAKAYKGDTIVIVGLNRGEFAEDACVTKAHKSSVVGSRVVETYVA